MNLQDIIALRKYAEGAYPQMKLSETSDAVWFDMMASYQLNGMMEALKTYIRSGNTYPPTVADLINGYETIISGFDSDIVEKMAREGVFDDSKGCDSEIADWNRTNRKNKALAWLSSPNRDRFMPLWFATLYDLYRTRVETKYFGKTPKQIGEN